MTVQAMVARLPRSAARAAGWQAEGLDGWTAAPPIMQTSSRRGSAPNVIHSKVACDDGARLRAQRRQHAPRRAPAPARRLAAGAGADLFVDGAVAETSGQSAARSGTTTRRPRAALSRRRRARICHRGWRGLLDEVRIAAKGPLWRQIAAEAANLRLRRSSTASAARIGGRG